MTPWAREPGAQTGSRPGMFNKAHAAIYALMAYQQLQYRHDRKEGDPMGQQMKEKMEREAAQKALKDVSLTFDIQASENELNSLFEAARDGLADRDEIFAEKVQDTIDRLEETLRSVAAERDTQLDDD